MNQHQKLDLIIAELEGIKHRVASLEENSKPQPEAQAEPRTAATSAASHTAVPPTAEEKLNLIKEEKQKAQADQDQLDADILQSYTYETRGTRDYRHPSNVEPELMQKARAWYAETQARVAH